MRHRIRASAGLLATACVTAAAAVAAGCASPAPLAQPVITRGVAATEPAADPRPFGAADTAFGLDVLHAWCAQHPGQNMVFSPATLATALGMAYLGARGSTGTAMARVLQLPADSRAALAAGLQARARALRGLSGPGVTLAADNRVWADPGLTTSRAYLNAVATGYFAGVTRAPLSTRPGQAAAQINKAISDATRGQIPRLVTPDMLAGIGWVLTSALYMHAGWAVPFDAARTAPGTFRPADARPVTVPYLNGAGRSYATADGWTGVALPYAGGKLTMTALLPPAGTGPCALPGQGALAAITTSLRGSGGPTATVSLPKVSLRTSGADGNMAPVLKRLGMGVAFSGTADFSGLSPEAGSMGFVQQAATLKVAEKGTVAAAAAAAGISFSAGLAASRTITFNRPYLLLVTATGTGEPLFLATVANPAAP